MLIMAKFEMSNFQVIPTLHDNLHELLKCSDDAVAVLSISLTIVLVLNKVLVLHNSAWSPIDQ